MAATFAPVTQPTGIIATGRVRCWISG